MPNKIGVNDPCPCGAKKPDGSPKKYKKCCYEKEHPRPIPQELAEKVLAHFRKKQQEEFLLREKGIYINYVKPCNYTNPKTGQRSRIWALGNRVFHTRRPTETFHEFIIDHLRIVLGQAWWLDQQQAEQKHFIYQCFEKAGEWFRRSATEKNKVDDKTWYAMTDGWTSTLLSLAFDVCSLVHTQHLPEHLLNRLRDHGEYQGAHYEISVAAMFARLGCDIEFLDENQVITTKHCEFIARHRDTGTEIAVEAKSRQRAGVKHRNGQAEDTELLKGDVQKLLNRALKQNPKDRPFLVFIDLNAPLSPEVEMRDKRWFKDIDKMMSAYQTPTPDYPEAHTGVIFTNYSTHYLKEREAQPNEYLAVIPLYAVHPLPSPQFRDMLLASIQNYGFVPHIKEDEEIV